jgi:hypothetical protein
MRVPPKRLAKWGVPPSGGGCRCSELHSENRLSADGVHELPKRAARFPLLARARATLYAVAGTGDWFFSTTGTNIRARDIKFYQKDLSLHTLLPLIPS